MNDGAGAVLPDVRIHNILSSRLYHQFRRFRKESSRDVMESLQEMILADGPSSYFHMSCGGIQIMPPIQRWSPSSFTFACWIAPILECEQALFSFEDDCGEFIAASIDCNGCIRLLSSGRTSNGLVEIETLHPALVPDKWKFICIRVVRGRSTPLIGRKPQIEITVDMIPVSLPDDVSFDFPKISMIADAGIGRLSDSARKRAPNISDFSGLLGAIYLFNDRVTSCSVVSSIFELGVDYCVPAISDPVNDNFFSRISHSLTGRTTDVLSLSCFVFSFHPRAMEDVYCIDTSPVDCDTGAVTASFAGNARSYVVPRLVDDIILQSRLFLVLLEHMDVLTQDDCDIHAEVINTIRFILSQPLYKHQAQLSDVCSFFDAAACILLRKDARFVSVRSAESYHSLVLHIWTKHDSIPSIVRALSNHLLRLDWWIRPEVNPDARLLLAETCRTIMLGQRGVTNFDLNAFVDRFHFYSCGTDQFLLRIRHQLLTAITDLNESHYHDIINFLDDCEHPLHTAQLIEFLASHLNNETDLTLIRDCFEVVLACAIRNTESLEVLIATLHCLNVIFTCSSLEISCSVFNNVISSSFPVLLSANRGPLLRNLLYRSFLELFLSKSPPGTLGVPNIITWKLLNDPVNPQFTMPNLADRIKSRKLDHPGLLFSSLPSFPDCIDVLRDIDMILQSPENKDVLLNQPLCSWQMPLFKLIKWDLPNFFAVDENYLIFEILNAILVHALVSRPNAAPIVRDTLSCLRVSAQQSSSTPVTSVERLVFPGLIQELRAASLQQPDCNHNDCFAKNLRCFGDLVEEESWCSSCTGKRRPSTAESAKLSVSLDSNSSESWVICSDELFDDPAGLKPLPIAEVLMDMAHVEVLISIVLRCRLPLHVSMTSTDDSLRCNLLQVFLNYLFEAISFSFIERSVSQLVKITETVYRLVDLASSDSCSLPGTNVAVVSFMQKTCTLLMVAESDRPSIMQHHERYEVIVKMCKDIVGMFSPFIAIQAHHYDDPLVTKVLSTSLANRRFGELQTLYIHESEASALSMILPPFTGPITCIPIDIDLQTCSITVHPHTLQLISGQSICSDSVQNAVVQSVFSALNEISKCEQSSRSARFADCLRHRKLSVSRIHEESNNAAGDTFSNDILPKHARRIRLNADSKQKKKLAFFAQEKHCELESQYLLKQIKHFMQCTGLAFWSDLYHPFWGLSPLFSSNASFTLHPWPDGTSHTEATHTFILQSQNSRLSLSDVRIQDADPSFSLTNDLTINKPPSTEADWDLCEVSDDAAVTDGAPREEGIGIDATLVTPIIRVNGFLRIDRQLIVFEQVSHDSLSVETKRYSCPSLEFERSRVRRRNQWQMSSLRNVQRRRYQLQHSALEFFFDVGTCVFFDFESPADQIRVIREISMLKPLCFDSALMSPPRTILRKSDITRRWQLREISNFDYLNALNLISGRTYQDLNQYPIFPWVISDYSSESIDLSKPEVYRDLSKPIGAQNDAQAALLAERYEHFIGSSIPPFHFGSHYSNAGIVIFYLLRLEPFSSLHIELQDGRFDFPDRLFSSIEQTYRVCTTNRSSVKELIPEFYTLPEMFVNCNKFDLGTTQSGVVVDDVQLPAWADNDPNKFVHINREALESEYVSANLHHWIDLIWGYKQRGAAAVESFNVFYHLSYEGAVDLESVSDPIQREAMRSQISQWGQTPLQLFSKPHAHRKPLSVLPRHLAPNLETMPLKMMRLDELSDTCICNLSMINSKTVMVISDCHTTNQLSLNVNSVDYHLTLHPIAVSSARPAPSHPNSRPLSDCVVWSESGRYVITGNHWDSSIRLYRFSVLSSSQAVSSNPFLKLATYTLLQSQRSHTGRITCLAASKCQTILLSGSEDCNIFVWSMFLDDTIGDIVHIKDTPLRVLSGHESQVICVAVDRHMNICVSCSSQPMCLVHRLSDGDLIRRIYFSPALHSVPTCILISTLGFLVFGCQATMDNRNPSTFLLTYSLNGVFRHVVEEQHCPVGVVSNISHKGDLIAFASLGRIVIYHVEDLSIVQTCHSVASSFTSVTFSMADNLVIGGTEDGRIHVYPIEERWMAPDAGSP